MSTLLFSHRFAKTRYLAGITFLFALLLTVLGTYARLNNPELSCVEWSNCVGLLMTRYGENVKNILILFLIFSLCRIPHPQKKQLKKAAFLLVLLIGAQIFLSKDSASQLLKPAMISIQLITRFSILAGLWWIYLTLKQSLETQTQSSAWSIWTVLALFVFAAQIALSGWISTHNKGLDCLDFPNCYGVFIPHLQWPFWNTDLISSRHLPHLASTMASAYLIGFSFSLLFSSSLKRFGLLLLSLTLLQITLGLLTIECLKPICIAMTSHGIAVAILLTLIALLIHVQSKAPSAPNYFNHLQRETSDTKLK